jgi:hypothetical protein
MFMLGTQFESYMGQEVKVEVVHFERDGKTYPTYTLSQDDTVIAEIEEAAKAAGLRFRCLLPGDRCTLEYDSQRLNVFVQGSESMGFTISRLSKG